ncbi:MAG: SARP family transcriptional regulator, partial [Oscillospiraceae bacterium]|nr:SARP family transcriptional regulator [Oscillospiraceae bacterium]
RDRVITQSEMIDVLWPSEDDVVLNPNNTLKTILFRARSLLDPLEYPLEIVTYSRGSYQINPRIPIVCDYEIFEGLINDSQNSDISYEDKLNILKQALNSYTDDFLVKSSYESWVVPLHAYFHSLYINAVLEIVEMLEERLLWQDIVAVCRKAIEIDPYIEDFHRIIINALVESGAYSAAIEHYNYITTLYFTQLGINPSEELISLYKQVRQTNNITEMDLVAIRHSMNEPEYLSGAFYCEYEFFKDIYRIELRTASRTGHSAYIGLLTVTGAVGETPSRRVLNNSMSMLYDSIQETLRRSDVFTRYSVSQYLVLIYTVSFETGEMVVDRILQSFRKDHPKATTKIDVRIQPLIIS